MRKLIARALFTAAVAALSPLASAHEFTCDEVAGVVQVDASGLPVIGWAALPVYASPASGVLTLQTYPAIVGFRVGIHNVAAETSVVTGVTDAFTAGLTAGRDYSLYGLFDVAPGFSLAPGGSAYLEYGIRVASQEDCLGRFGADASGAPVCTDTGEDRFVVTHDVGSTECRARIVCGAPGHGPAPAPLCPSAWHGVKQFGDSGSAHGAQAMAVALDQQCNVHATGFTEGSLDGVGTHAGAYGAADAFIESLTPAGDRYEAIEWGGAGNETGYGIGTDLAGNRYVTFTAPRPAGGEVGNVAKFDATGAMAWTTVVEDMVWGIAVDVSGVAYAAGGALSETNHWTSPAVTKVAPDGAVVWTRTLDASGQYPPGFAYSVALDRAGNVLVAGSTNGAFPGQTNAGGPDAFVAKLDADGNVLWVTQLGSSDRDEATGVAADGAGNVLVAGSIGYGAHPFVAKLDAAGNLIWKQLFAVGEAAAVAANAAGDVWVAGDTSGGYSSSDAFVARFRGDGTEVFYRQFGTSGGDQALGIALDAGDDAFVSGMTFLGSFGPPTPGMGAWVAKFDPLGTLQ